MNYFEKKFKSWEDRNFAFNMLLDFSKENPRVDEVAAKDVIPNHLRHNAYSDKAKRYLVAIQNDDTMMATILPNMAKCKHCKDVIQSKYRHDYVVCSCGAIALDGGYEYFRALGDLEDVQYMRWDNSLIG